MLSKKSWKWRLTWLKEAITYLKSGEDIDGKPDLASRLRFFFGTLRVFLPLPGRISKKMGIKFSLGLKYIATTERGKIYEKKGIQFYIPDKFLFEFFNIYRDIVIHKHYEEPPVMVNTGDIIIDCGANLGIATIYFAQRAGKDGLIVALEPEENNFYVLQKVAELNKDNLAKIIPLKKAVYKENTEIDFCITKKSGHHFLATYSENKEVKKEIIRKEKVPAVTIDNLVKELNLTKVDFIKMDIEGAEIDALLGAEETIKTFAPKLAICSYHREGDSEKIKALIRLFNPKYEYKELEKGEKVIFAWDPRKIS